MNAILAVHDIGKEPPPGESNWTEAENRGT